MRIAIHGQSDDNVDLLINGKVIDEYGCYDHRVDLHVASSEGGIILTTQFGKHGWTVSAATPFGHDDGQPVLPAKIFLAENGHALVIEAQLENIVNLTSLVLTVGGTPKATWHGGKVVTWEQIEELRNTDRCPHGMFKTGIGACPMCPKR